MTRDREVNRKANAKIFLRNPRILLSISLLYVSIFAEIPLTPASPERNDGR